MTSPVIPDSLLPSHPSATPIDVLVVDDDESIREVMLNALARWGYSVIAAANGKTALYHLSRHRFRIVITDILMPDMDGLELILHYVAVHPKISFLAISGGGRIGEPDSVLVPARHLGCIRTLAKPFELEDLHEAVRELLAGACLKKPVDRLVTGGARGDRQTVRTSVNVGETSEGNRRKFTPCALVFP